MLDGYYLKSTTNEVMAIMKEVIYKVDVNTMEQHEDDKTIKMNDMALVRIRTTRPIVFDEYRKNRITGSLILIDEATNETVAAGTIQA